MPSKMMISFTNSLKYRVSHLSDKNNMNDIDMGCEKEEMPRGWEEEKVVNFDQNLDWWDNLLSNRQTSKFDKLVGLF